MNDGCLRPVELVIPEGSMLRPRYPAAVVAGNVETSQVVVDALYGALGVMARGQGTMNNFTFGDERRQYYETICGGRARGRPSTGPDAVQTHMTNSRLTDPEVLETRYPVLVEAFSIRRGSGGAGRHPGGDGVVRKIGFREPMTATLLSNRRRVPPFGLAGGEAGALGKAWVERADGSVQVDGRNGSGRGRDRRQHRHRDAGRRRVGAGMSKPSVLFVCLGNICRSPLAEAAFRAEAERLGLDVEVDSAGTGDWHKGEPPDRRAIAAARAPGRRHQRLAGASGDSRGLPALHPHPGAGPRQSAEPAGDASGRRDGGRWGCCWTMPTGSRARPWPIRTMATTRGSM
jgi:hypothetical protein